MWIHRTEEIGSGRSKISSLLFSELDESLLPHDLLALSSMSMTSAREIRFRPREVRPSDVSIDDSTLLESSPAHELPQRSMEPIRITPRPTHAAVAAVDVSSIKLGDTEYGVLWALRGATVWNVDGSYAYLRCGPLAFHITIDAEQNIYKELSRTRIAPFDISVPPALRVANRLRNIMERWMQRRLCAAGRGAIVLLDGSLTAGTPDNSARYLQQILQLARENEHAVLAISKETRLVIGARRVTSLLDHYNFPCLVDIDDCINSQFPSGPVKLMGRVLVAKLAAHSLAFRLDVDRELTKHQSVDAVCRLLDADLVSQGYPETLRLAHILSAFTANEVIAIQRFIATAHGLRICPQLNIHRQLFGPFGTSRESSI